METFRPLVDDFSFGSSALIGLLVIAVAIATVIVISLVLLRKRQYGTISHGIVEVSEWSHINAHQCKLEDNNRKARQNLSIPVKDNAVTQGTQGQAGSKKV